MEGKIVNILILVFGIVKGLEAIQFRQVKQILSNGYGSRCKPISADVTNKSLTNSPLTWMKGGKKSPCLISREAKGKVLVR